MVSLQRQRFDFSEKVGLDYLRTLSPTAYIPIGVVSGAFGDSEQDIARLGGRGFRWPTFSESNTTTAANLTYRFIKDLEKEGNSEKLKKYPIKRWAFLTETGSDGGIPDLEYAFSVVSSRLLNEDERKYKPIVESSLRYTWMLPIIFNCGSGGPMLDVYLPALALEMDSSAAFISVDTSAYDKDYSGKNAHWTVGSGGTLGWITPEARVMYFDRKASASYNMNEFGFTKYWSKHVPKTHGMASLIAYDYMGIKAYEQLEMRYELQRAEYFIWHVPFVEQPKVFYTLPYVHNLRHYDPDAYARLIADPSIGPEKLNGFKSFSDMLDEKFTSFNRNGEGLSDAEILAMLEKDQQIRDHLGWLKGVRRSPGFERELETKQVTPALRNNEERGNMYANGTFGMVGGLLEHGQVYEGMPGLVGFFGSGGIASLFGSAIAGEQKTIKQERIFIDKNSKVQLDKSQYLQLYYALLQEESKRTTTGEDLVEKDLKFLGRDTLTPGFHMRRRYQDGTGDWVFVDDDGMMSEVHRRY
ncbi:MAG: hypothetical protein KGI04_04420 [Candidatus Micrarchaeota archaeon]|nr:hypothetical protein [Candidatus Micrarchaeota archaeon]